MSEWWEDIPVIDTDGKPMNLGGGAAVADPATAGEVGSEWWQDIPITEADGTPWTPPQGADRPAQAEQPPVAPVRQQPQQPVQQPIQQQQPAQQPPIDPTRQQSQQPAQPPQPDTPIQLADGSTAKLRPDGFYEIKDAKGKSNGIRYEQETDPATGKSGFRPHSRQVQHDGETVNVPHYVDDDTLQWHLQQDLAKKGKLELKDPAGRSQGYDPEEHMEQRQATPVGKQANEEWAKSLSGVDGDGKPFTLKPEDVTPEGLALVAKRRKEWAESIDGRAAELANPFAYKQFVQETAAMKRDLARRWESETTGAWYERHLDTFYSPEEVKTRAVNSKAATESDSPEVAREKLVAWKLYNRTPKEAEADAKRNPAQAREDHLRVAAWLQEKLTRKGPAVDEAGQMQVPGDEATADEKAKLEKDLAEHMHAADALLHSLPPEAQQRIKERELIENGNPSLAVVPQGADGDEKYAAVPVGARFVDADGNWYRKDGPARSDAKKMTKEDVIRESRKDWNTALSVLSAFGEASNRSEQLKALEKLRPDQYPMVAIAAASTMPDATKGLTAVADTLLPARLTVALGRGFWDWAESIVELTGLGGDAEQMRVIHAVRGIYENEMPMYREDEPFYTKFPMQAAHMFGPMYAMAVAGRGMGKAGGVGSTFLPTAVRQLPKFALRAKQVGTVAGITAAGFPQIYRTSYNAIRDAGVSEGKAKWFAAGGSLLSAAIESAVPDPFRVKHAKSVRQFIARLVTRYAIETVVEEGGQAGVEEMTRVISTWFDENAPDLDMSEVKPKIMEAVKQSWGPMLILMGGPAALSVPGEYYHNKDVQARTAKAWDALLEKTRKGEAVSRTDAQLWKRVTGQSLPPSQEARTALVRGMVEKADAVKQALEQSQTTEQVTELENPEVIEEGQQPQSTQQPSQQPVAAAESAGQAASAAPASQGSSGQPSTNIASQPSKKKPGYFVAPEYSTNAPDKHEQLDEGRGWKLHLTVAPENIDSARERLAQLGLTFKHESGGSHAEGKDFTVYVGSRAKADSVAGQINKALGELLAEPQGSVLGDDAVIDGKVRGRFDVGGNEFHQYGYDGIPALLTEVNKKWGRPLKDLDYTSAKQRLAKLYGEFFTGEAQKSTGRKTSPSGPAATANAQAGQAASAQAETDAEARVEDEAVSEEAYEAMRYKAVEKASAAGYKVTARDPRTPEEEEVLAFLRARGKQASFVKAGSKFLGATDPETGFILLRGDRQSNDLWQTVGHEVAHESGLDKVIPADSAMLAKARNARLKRAGAAYRQRLEGDPDLLDREARADVVGQFLRDKNFRDRLARENPTVWESIRDFVLKVLGKWTPSDTAKAAVVEELRLKAPGAASVATSQQGQLQGKGQAAATTQPATEAAPAVDAELAPLAVDTDWNTVKAEAKKLGMKIKGKKADLISAVNARRAEQTAKPKRASTTQPEAVSEPLTKQQRTDMQVDVAMHFGRQTANTDAEQAIMAALGVESVSAVPRALKTADDATLREVHRINQEDKAAQEQRAQAVSTPPAEVAEPAEPEGVHGFGFGSENLPDPATVSRQDWIKAYYGGILVKVLPADVRDSDLPTLATMFDADSNPFAPDSPLMKMMGKFSVDGDLWAMNWSDGINALATSDQGRALLADVMEQVGYVDATDPNMLEDPPVEDVPRIARELQPRLEQFLAQVNPDEIATYGVPELLEMARMVQAPLAYAMTVWDKAQKRPGKAERRMDTKAEPAAKEPWQMTREEYEATEPKGDGKWEAFQVGDVTVVKNPTAADLRDMAKAFREKYPAAPSDSVKVRSTVDSQGNKYSWMSDAAHDQVEPVINERYGTTTNQNGPERELHRYAVGQALSEGKPVPAAVRAQYPGLSQPAVEQKGKRTLGEKVASKQAPFQVDEQLQLDGPGGRSMVSYRGPGTERGTAVVWSGTMQFTVPVEQLSRPVAKKLGEKADTPTDDATMEALEGFEKSLNRGVRLQPEQGLVDAGMVVKRNGRYRLTEEARRTLTNWRRERDKREQVEAANWDNEQDAVVQKIEAGEPVTREELAKYQLTDSEWEKRAKIVEAPEPPAPKSIGKQTAAQVAKEAKAEEPAATSEDVAATRETSTIEAPSQAGVAENERAKRDPAQRRADAADRAPIATSGQAGNTSPLVLADSQPRSVQYVAVEAGQIIPSHDARRNFAKNPEGDINERPYHDPKEGQSSRLTVENIAKADPNKIALLTSDTTSPTDGPPITDPLGIVLGGNARSMGIQLAYHRGGDVAARIKQATVQAAAKFGIDANAVAAMEQPIIVRVLTDAGVRGELSAILNEALTTGKTQATTAVSRGRKVSAVTADKIATYFEPDGDGDVPSMRDVLSSPAKAAQIVRRLLADGAWTQADADRYTDATTAELNDDGKTAIEQLLLGRMTDDPTIVGTMPKKLRRLLLSSLGTFVRLLSDAKRGGRFADVLRDAVEAYPEYKAAGVSLRQYFFDQESFVPFPGQNDEAVALLVDAMDRSGTRQFRSSMNNVAQALGLEGAESQGMLFEAVEKAATVDDALRQEFATDDIPPDVQAMGRTPAQPKAKPAKPKSLVEKTLEDSTDEELQTVARANRIRARTRAGIIAAIEKNPELRKAIEEEAPEEAKESDEGEPPTFDLRPLQEAADRGWIPQAIVDLFEVASQLNPNSPQYVGSATKQRLAGAEIARMAGTTMQALADDYGITVEQLAGMIAPGSNEPAIINGVASALIKFYNGVAPDTVIHELAEAFYKAQSQEWRDSVDSQLREFYDKLGLEFKNGREEYADQALALFFAQRRYKGRRLSDGDRLRLRDIFDGFRRLLSEVVLPAVKLIRKAIRRGDLRGDLREALEAPFKLGRETERASTGSEVARQGDATFQLRAPDTPEFKQWFGDSKVVDENGEPLVVYHGTNVDFPQFDEAKFGSRMKVHKIGFFAINDPDKTEQYARTGVGANVKPLYMRIVNPLRVTADEFYALNDQTEIDFKQQAVSRGHDGIIVEHEHGSQEYVAFRPNQLKSASGNTGAYSEADPRITFQLQPSQRWYSKAGEVIEEKMGRRASPPQVLAMLKNSGIKAEELQWSGLDELLGRGLKSVTKEEVLEAIDNGVRIEEVVRSETPERRAKQERLNELAAMGSDRDSAQTREYERLSSQLLHGQEHGGKPKFAAYTLPGGENYVELLLTLSTADVTRQREELDAQIRELSQWPENPERAKDPADQSQLEQLLTQWDRLDTRESGYTGPHYDEPNVVAHLRMNERVDSDGKKVLFIEEIQSDWHQEGRKRGYRKPSGKKVYTVFHGNGDRYNSFETRELAEETLRALKDPKQGWSRVAMEGFHIKEEAENARDMERSVPDAPFKTTWPMLAMKRAIQHAAENGFERIAWTTGTQQAARYDLSKQVKRIHWSMPTGGEWIGSNAKNVFIDHTAGVLRLTVDNTNGNVVDARGPGSDQVQGKLIDDVIGKEIAQTIMGEDRGDFSGDDLKVGGAGMKAFYDRMLPNEVNKFIKRFGAKVGQTQMPNPQSMRPIENNGLWYLYDPITEDTVSGDALGVNDSASSLEFGSREEAMAFIRSRGKMGGLSQPAFDITPAMRQSALQHGQPTFQLKPGQRMIDMLLERFGPKDEVPTSKVPNAKPAPPRKRGSRVAGTRVPPNPIPARETPSAGLADHELTGVATAVMNDLRELADLPELQGTAPQTVEQWVEDAAATVASDKFAPSRLLGEIMSNPTRALDHHDVMLLAWRYRELANEAEPYFQEMVAASESGDPQRIAMARTEFIRARAPMDAFEELVHKTVATWGRTGVALQALIRKDNSYDGLIRRARQANHGEPLSDAQQEQMEKEMAELAAKFASVQKQLAEETARAEAAEAEAESARHHAATVAKVKPRRRPTPKEKTELDSLWAEFAKDTGATLTFQLRGEVSFQAKKVVSPAEAIVSKYRDLGVTAYAELRRHMRERLGDEQAAKLEKQFRQAWENTKPETEVDVDIDTDDLAELTREARASERNIVEGLLLDYTPEQVIEMRDEVVDAVHEEMRAKVGMDFTRRQTMDALSAYGQFSRPSQETTAALLRALNAEVLKLVQIDQMEAAIKRADELREQGLTEAEIGDRLIAEDLLVKPTGRLRDTPTDRLRALTRKYAELKKDIPSSTEGRANLLQTAVAAIERGLANRIRDLREAIAHPDRGPISKGRKASPTNEKIERMRGEVESLSKIYRELFPPERKKLTPERRLANAIKAAERSAAIIDKQLESRNFDKPEREALQDSPALAAAQERLRVLRAQREAAKALELSAWEGEGGAITPDLKEAARRKAYIAAKLKQIENLHRFMEEGDFSPRKKKLPRKLSPREAELQRMYAELNEFKMRKMAEYHLQHLKGVRWTADKAAEMLHLSRAIMTSIDASFLGRQGGLVALGHPLIAKNVLFGTVGAMLRTIDPAKLTAFKNGVTKDNLKDLLTLIDSRAAEFTHTHELMRGEWGEFRALAGLAITSSDEKITRQEEAFQGRWGKHVPGIAISGRLYTMMANQMRADLFDFMCENLGRGGEVTLAEAKMIASFVNIATGRSDFKGVPIMEYLENQSHLLNLVFFAPRYVASRFQYLTMPFYLPFKGGLKANWRVKRAILKEYARTVRGLAAVLFTLGVVVPWFYDDDDDEKPTVEWWDTTLSDWWKVKIGETRLDFLGGLQQVFVLSSRLRPEWLGGSRIGDRKFYEGGPYELTHMNVLGKFLRTKLAPAPGFIWTALDGWKNVVGQVKDRAFGFKVHPAIGTTLDMFTPLSMRDIEETMQMRGVPKGSALSLLALTGVGMNTYGPETEYVTGTPEQRTKQFSRDLRNMQWDTPPLAYEEFLTTDQMKLAEDRKAERIEEVIRTAAHNPDPASKTYTDLLNKRNAARESLRDMGLSYEQAQELLAKSYWRPVDGKVGSETKKGIPKKEYKVRSKVLDELYGRSRPDYVRWRQGWAMERRASEYRDYKSYQDSLESLRAPYGRRKNGSPKGTGFLGELKLPRGGVATEYTVGVEIDGTEMEIPTLVPTLTEAELRLMITDIIPNHKLPPRSIIDKAVAHAKKRMEAGEPVFAD